MYPEDRVLVGVINRKRDFIHARDDGWYRIPQVRLPRGIHAEYVAFFLSRAFKEQNGGIHYFAARKGIELLYRKDILPKEADHARANDVYYKVGISPLREKAPPIKNPTNRPISFVYTTWDRFVHASTIADLYSTADYFVDRIFHALRDKRIIAARTWEAETRETGVAPQLRILCENTTFTASTAPDEGDMYLDATQPDDEILKKILEAISRNGGPVMLNIPFDYF
jgi:hypothetical protein